MSRNLHLLLTDFSHHYWSPSPDVVSQLSPRPLYILLCIDWLICHLVVGPLGVAVWRGTWDYSNMYLDEGWCQGDLTMSNLVAGAVGLLGTLAIDLW